MTLTDGRRQRHDLGPCSAWNGVGDAVVDPTPGVRTRWLCAVCIERPAVGGRLTCGRVCARARMDRPAVAW